MRQYFLAFFLGSLLTSGTLFAQSKIEAPTSSPVPATESSGSTPAQEAVRTAKLEVDGKWCVACSYIVTQALKKTPGVVDASVSSRDETAVVTYDPNQVTVADLIAATGEHGFTSRIVAR